MKKILSGILACLVISSVQLQAQQVIDSLVTPESVLKVDNKRFVSSMRGGFISELSAMENSSKSIFKKQFCILFAYYLKSHSSTSYTNNCGTADLYYEKSSGNVYISDLPKNRILIENVRSLKQD